VTTTLLPAILGGVGPRIDWPRLRQESSASRPWLAWGRLVVRHRAVAAAVAAVALGLLIVPFSGMKVGETSPDALAKNGPAHAAYQQLASQRVPGGVLTPLEVLVRSGAARTVQHKLAAVPGIAAVADSAAADSNRSGTTVLIAIPEAANLNSSASTAVTEARNAISGLPGVIGIAGLGAIQLDYVHAVFGNFPLMLGVIAVLTLVLLAGAFRSVVLPVKAVVLNLVSLAATFGAITWFWQQGHGSQAVFGIPATGAVTFWLPLMIFAFMFGLSMDYEVFILARMREEYDRTGSTRHAVTEGLGRTGRLVTSAALILFLAFASLASGPDTDIKVFATALGAGILLDATVVRALLVPATVALFGRWNWWLPGPLAKIFPARPAEVPAVPSPVRQAGHDPLPRSLAGVMSFTGLGEGGVRGVEGSEYPVHFGVRHAELAELVRQGGDVRGGYRAEAAVAAAAEGGADGAAAGLGDRSQAGDAAGHHDARGAAQLAVVADAVPGDPRLAARQQRGDQLEQLAFVDRAAAQLEVDRDVVGHRRGGGQRRDVLGPRVHHRGELGHVGEVAQRLDPACGGARADHDQELRRRPDLGDPPGVPLGGHRALHQRHVVRSLGVRA